MDKRVQAAAVGAIIATILFAVFMLLGFVPIPESPTYSKWVKATVGLLVYGIIMFIVFYLFLRFKLS